MEGEPQKDPKFPLWIIEYVWAHKTTEIQDVVDASDWPDLDSQPLSLQDSWRLRVASARVYSIVKTRDMEHFERVMSFLEATYRLLPRLVTPIKHMKIMFGLKTMVIMWMLSEGRGMVDTVLKTSHFFPRTLPQYQDQCTQREMFLMRQTHLDFKALAQALAVDKDQLDEYMKSRMEEQYGDRYAQKVADRLLHYLQQLEAELPRDTYVDQILKKGSPVTEEEKLLLEVVTSDSTNIATTLKKMLLHCDVASCRPARISPSREASASCPQVSLLVESGDAAPQVEEDGEEVERTREDGVEGGGEVISARRFCSKHQRWSSSILQACPDPEELRADACSSPLLFPSSSSTASSQDLTPSDIIPGPFDIIPCPSDIIPGPFDIILGPFNIILGPSDIIPGPSDIIPGPSDIIPGPSDIIPCPSDIIPGPSDIIPCPSDIIPGPSDIIPCPSDIIPGPSDIIPCPPDRPSLTSAHLQTAVQTSERANPGNEPGPPSDASQRGPPPNPQSRDPQRPFPLLPVVQLVDILACCSPAVRTLADRRPSGNNATPPGLMMDTTPDRMDAVSPADPPNIPSHSTGRQPATRQSIHELSRKFRLTRASSRPSQALVDGSGPNPPAEQLDESPSIFWAGGTLGPDSRVSGPPTADASTSKRSPVCAADQIPPSTGSPGNVAPQNSFKPGPRTHNYGRGPTSDSDRLVGGFEPGGVRGAQLRLSLQSQVVLLQSTLLQPYVALRRLSAQQRRHGDDEEGREEDADSSFDVNTLYSSSGSEDSFDSDDPEYTPR